jgi:hypothetical protein
MAMKGQNAKFVFQGVHMLVREGKCHMRSLLRAVAL